MATIMAVQTNLRYFGIRYLQKLYLSSQKDTLDRFSSSIHMQGDTNKPSAKKPSTTNPDQELMKTMGSFTAQERKVLDKVAQKFRENPQLSREDLRTILDDSAINPNHSFDEVIQRRESPQNQMNRSYQQQRGNLMHNREEDRTSIRNQESMLSYYSSQQGSNNLSYRHPQNRSQQDTFNETRNDNNFSYQSQHNNSRQNQSEQLLQLVQELDVSEIHAVQESSFRKESIRPQDKIFETPLQILGYPLTQHSADRARKSQESLRSDSDLFIEDKETRLFKMDLSNEKGHQISKKFIERLKKYDTYLLNRIEIGSETTFEDLVKIFPVWLESLQEIRVIRKWGNQEFPQHGLEFIKNEKNFQKIIKIQWKCDKWTDQLIKSCEVCPLPSLKLLEIELTERFKNQKEESLQLGKSVVSLFKNIADHNDSKFKIYLISSIKNEEELGRPAQKYVSSKRLFVERSAKFAQNEQVVKNENEERNAQQRIERASQQIPAPTATQTFTNFTVGKDNAKFSGNVSIGGNIIGQ